MNWSDLQEQDKSNQGQETHALYMGDMGELSMDARRVLVQLLAGPSLDGQRHSKLWPVLLRYELAIASRLSELFLELVIDKDLQVAFTRQADTGELDTPSLLRRAPLTFIDSILLLHLRQQLTQAEAQGERAVISIDEMVEFIRVYEKSGNSDRAGFEKRIDRSIDKAKKYSILRKIRSTEDRFEISPTLKILFSAEEIQALTQIYQGFKDRKEAPESSEQPIEAGKDGG